MYELSAIFVNVDCTLYTIHFFFFKQKTAYEMRISDWSSDVCSSDLVAQNAHENFQKTDKHHGVAKWHDGGDVPLLDAVMAEVFSTNASGEQIGRASCRERVCKYV